MATTIRASEAGLKRVDQARRTKKWNKYEQAWYQLATTSKATLKRFWAKNSIDVGAFENICKTVGIEDWEVIADLAPFHPSPSALHCSIYNPQTFTGREAMVSDLLPKLQGQTRLLWITGISGIGKTTLGECLASKAWESDPSFQWIYLEILEGQSPDFASVAADLLTKLGDRDLDPQERNNPDRLAKRLLQKLQSHPYWIQIDSLERLLNPEKPTEFVDAYWATFLQRCLTESNVISRLVLTAQAFPTALIEFSDRYPNAWAEYRLDGLLQVEQQLEFFAKRGVIIESSNQDILTRIAKIYEGHPLVLKVIAEDILNSFAGDVSCYWQIYQPEFEQVARELQATRLDETEYNEALDRKVRERIKRSLEQLPADALDLLCRSAVFRRPVPKKFWLAMIGDQSLEQQKVAYRVLDDHALIEKEGVHQRQLLIRQHNLIRQITYDLLLKSSTDWKVAENLAATLWLTHYQPQIDDSNLEKVRGYLEAFYHNCNIKSWALVQKIFLSNLNTSTSNQLHWQLGIWGYYKEQIQIYKKFLELAEWVGDPYWIGNALGGLGNAYYSISDYPQSLEYFEKKKLTSTINKDRKGEGEALGSISSVYRSMGKLSLAINFCEQAIKIFREENFLNEEVLLLGNLANIYLDLRDYTQAIKSYKESLEKMEVLNLAPDELLSNKAHIFVNLGCAYLYLKDYSEAEKYYSDALLISNEIDADKKLQAALLSGFGNLYEELENYPQAEICFQKRLTIAKEINDTYGEAYALNHLGIVFSKLRKFSEALEFFNEAKLVCTRTGNTSYEVEILKNIAIL